MDETARVTRDVFDVVIIGAGVVGVASAYYLARQAASVVVVDEAAHVGAGCSYGNGGIISPSHCIPLAAPGIVRQLPLWLAGQGEGISVRPRASLSLLRFGVRFIRSSRRDRMLAGLRCLRDLGCRSRDLFDELARDESLSFGYHTDGLMNVCRTERAFERLVADADLLEREGLKPEVLDTVGAQRREPALRDDIVGAVYWPEDAHCEPHRFVTELAQAAERRGAEFRLGAGVSGMHRSARGSIDRVQTGRGEIRARTVIIAAGAWTAPLVRTLSLKVPLEPAKGYHLDIDTSASQLRMPLILQELVSAATPMNGRLRLVGRMEFVGLDLSLDRRRALGLRDAARLYLSGLESAGSSAVWCGLRPCTPDTLPLVGRSTVIHNLVYATGHGMLGLTLAPITGFVVAELATGRQPSMPVEMLSPARFGV